VYQQTKSEKLTKIQADFIDNQETHFSLFCPETEKEVLRQ
jgi:hypothetical protein